MRSTVVKATSISSVSWTDLEWLVRPSVSERERLRVPDPAASQSRRHRRRRRCSRWSSAARRRCRAARSCRVRYCRPCSRNLLAAHTDTYTLTHVHRSTHSDLRLARLHRSRRRSRVNYWSRRHRPSPYFQWQITSWFSASATLLLISHASSWLPSDSFPMHSCWVLLVISSSDYSQCPDTGWLSHNLLS